MGGFWAWPRPRERVSAAARWWAGFGLRGAWSGLKWAEFGLKWAGSELEWAEFGLKWAWFVMKWAWPWVEAWVSLEEAWLVVTRA